MQQVIFHFAFEDQICRTLFPLRRYNEADSALVDFHARDGPSAAELAHKATDQRVTARKANVEPGRIIALGTVNDQVPATNGRCRFLRSVVLTRNCRERDQREDKRAKRKESERFLSHGDLQHQFREMGSQRSAVVLARGKVTLRAQDYCSCTVYDLPDVGSQDGRNWLLVMGKRGISRQCKLRSAPRRRAAVTKTRNLCPIRTPGDVRHWFAWPLGNDADPRFLPLERRTETGSPRSKPFPHARGRSRRALAGCIANRPGGAGYRYTGQLCRGRPHREWPSQTGAGRILPRKPCRAGRTAVHPGAGRCTGCTLVCVFRPGIAPFPAWRPWSTAFQWLAELAGENLTPRGVLQLACHG